MIEVATAIIGQIWPYLVAAGVGLAALATAFFKGRANEKAKQAAERLAARTEADKIDQAVAGMSDAEVLKEQARWSRPKS